MLRQRRVVLTSMLAGRTPPYKQAMERKQRGEERARGEADPDARDAKAHGPAEIEAHRRPYAPLSDQSET